MCKDDADELVARLDLRPHLEGGAYVETWRATSEDGARAAGSAIYYLLRAGERSAWHRIDADEVWHFYAGDPLRLSVRTDAADGARVDHVLGPRVVDGQQPQVVVPAGAWQSAEPLGAWSLVGCTVSPAFELEGFELAAGEPTW